MDRCESDFSRPRSDTAQHNQDTVLYVLIEIRRSVDPLWATVEGLQATCRPSGYHADSRESYFQNTSRSEVKLNVG
jgi:hypothetical protein